MTTANPSGSEVEGAMRSMQQFFGLTETGALDQETMDMMSHPRCGVADVEPGTIPGNRRRRYSILGAPWDSTYLTYRYVVSPIKDSYVYIFFLTIGILLHFIDAILFILNYSTTVRFCSKPRTSDRESAILPYLLFLRGYNYCRNTMLNKFDLIGVNVLPWHN